MHYIKESHQEMSFNNVEVINEKNFKVKSEERVKLYDQQNQQSQRAMGGQ